MGNRINKLIICLFLITVSHSYSQYVIKGKLAGSNGKPMKRADIVWVSNLESFPRSVIQKIKVSSDGNFEFDTHRKGLHRIWFVGVGHKPFRIPFYLDKPDTTIINVQLQSNFTKGLKRITLQAGYNSKTDNYLVTDTLLINGNEVIKKNYKGYGPEFRYNLKETGNRNYFAGTMVDKCTFECDSTFEEGYNYYYSNIINTKKDSWFQFEFDPTGIASDSLKENYSFIKADDKTIKFLIMHEDFERAHKKYSDYVNDGYKKGIYDPDYANAYSYAEDMEQLDKKIEEEKDPFMKNCWIVSRISTAFFDAWGRNDTKVSKKLAQQALDSLTPDSPLWSYYSVALNVALRKASESFKEIADSKKNTITISGMNNPYLDYAVSALNNHPDQTIRKGLYEIAIGNASKFKRSDVLVYYLDKFKEEYPGERDHKYLMDRHNPKRTIKENNKIPPFEFASVQDSNKTVSNTDMLGKKYLIHMWADWCAGCRVELDAVRNLHKKFSGKNFAVLSVSICFNKENLLKFQKDHPMPWFNTHIDMNNDKVGFMKDFEVSSIPKDILVDENGKILAVNNLDKILEILSKK